MTDDDTYSIYEAKARFSEVIRRVREGRTVRVTWHGKPVAEVRPIGQKTGTEARIEWLRNRGVIRGPEDRTRDFSPVARRPGALARFLADRNRF